MKVKITHTLDLNKVPEKVNDLIKPTKRKLEKTLHHLSSIEFLLLEGSTESVSLSRMHLDALRKSLASIDVELEEAHSMIIGVDEYNQQVALKETMEEQLAKEEQEREQQLSQEFHGQEYVPEDVKND